MASDRARLLLHPVRMQVVIALGAEDLTARDLQNILPDVPQASLYRALKQLEQGGAIEIVKEERKGGAMERTYRALPDQALLTPEEFTSGSVSEFLAAVQTFSDLIVTTAAHTVAATGDKWKDERYSMRHDSVWLTAEERAELSEDLRAVYAKYTALNKRDGTAPHALMVAALPEKRVCRGDDAAGG
ncbi:helix-turn-helix domain-containing protein [Demequina globuliformis]|uniref:helix-turn-helix domain-containing protein n=1 Tax=Demequina globuliformis TaxID=676202 RepID=UPI0007843D90|nr:helix-turn-helix domain-containing protein [Demequina globuliformis]